MKTSPNNKENRKHPRTPVRLPLHFQTNENGGAYPGLTIDASESGLLIQTLKEMPVGIRIDIEILFPKKLSLPNFKAEAEIVWKDICSRGDWEGYQYGLKFIRVSKEDYLKLRRILSNALCLNEIDLIERRGHPLGLVAKQNETIRMGSYRVLIVDDEEMIRNFLCSLLPRYGHRCEVAKDGIEALEKIKNDSFDAVVVDIVMPHMDGVTLTEELLRLYSNLPVMLMTGHAQEHSAESAMAAGAREFIEKPFSIQEFIIRFDKMMRDHKGEKALLALSLTDELTGLCNRRRFFILTEQYFKVAIRTKKRPLLLFIDMDDLKGINDRHGHNEGDQALIDLANILKRTFRESDIIARIGGDEFVVLLESTDENCETLITRLHENVKDYNAQRSQRILSISLGTAQFDPESPISIDELLSKSDALMYAQKRRAKEILQRNRKMRVETHEKKPETITLRLPIETR
jgi:diguanylate cyclase (GGDEF)-like protein